MTAESQIVEHEEEAISRQQRDEHVSAITNKPATTEEQLEAVFSVWSMQRPYSDKPAAVS
jgi:hypothetical protein